MSNETTVIDGVGPMPVHRPREVAELQEIVRRAKAEGQALFPMGGGTSLGLGNPPQRTGWAVDCRGLDSILDYPARDMTITVQAGVSIARIQETLAKENQRLPIDVPRPAEATVGGVVAANVSGPRRLGFGTLRDYVIGISAINDDGEEFKAGGRVVKNVAGYDICKLLVGSLGTLGIISQVTLKLRPLAEASELVLLPVSEGKLAEFLDRLHETRTRPVAVELVDAQWAGHANDNKEAWTILVGFEGSREAVEWQVKQLTDEWRGQGEVKSPGAEAARGLWDALIAPPRDDASCIFKANLLPSGLAHFCQEQRKAGAFAIRAHAASGIVWGYGKPGLTPTDASVMLNTWRQSAAQAQGRVIVAQCPSEWKASLSVWGPEADDAWLMREVKSKFDPRGMFNPGRFGGY